MADSWAGACAACLWSQAAAVNLRHCAMAAKARVIRATVEEVLASPERFLPGLPRRLWLQQPHCMQQLHLLLEAQKQRTSEQRGAAAKLLPQRGLEQQHSDSDWLSSHSPRHCHAPQQPQPEEEKEKEEKEEEEKEEAKTRHSPPAAKDETDYQTDTASCGSSLCTPQMQQIAEKVRLIEADEAAQGAFGLVFACPPYTEVVYKDLIQMLLRCCVVGDDALVVVEYPKEIGCLPRLIRDEASPAALIGLRNRLYGRTCLAVYAKQKLFGVYTPDASFGGLSDLPSQEANTAVETVHFSNAEKNTFANSSRGDQPSCVLVGGIRGHAKESGEKLFSIEADVGAGHEGESKTGTTSTFHSNTSMAGGREGEAGRVSLMLSSRQMGVSEAYNRNHKRPSKWKHADAISLLPRTSRWYGHEKGREFVPLFMNKKQLLAQGWLAKRRRPLSSVFKEEAECAANDPGRP